MNGLARRRDLSAAGIGDRLGITRGIGGAVGVAGHLVHRRRHLGDRSGGHLHFLVLLVDALGSVLGDRMQLFGGGRQLRGRALDVLQGVAQGLLHLPDRLLHLGDLVTPAALDGTTQVTCGDRGCRLLQRFQRPADAAQQDHGENPAADQHDQQQTDVQHPIALIERQSALVLALGFAQLQADQLAEALGNRVDQRVQIVDDERGQALFAVAVENAFEVVQRCVGLLHQHFDAG